MFGYIKPNFCSLSKEEQQLYKSVYCGLCHSLGKMTGQLSRLTLNYDFVLLALLHMLVKNETPSYRTRRCLVHPFKGCSSVLTSDTLDRCAALSVLLVQESIEDSVSDEKGFSLFKAKIAQLPARIFLKKASKRFELPTTNVKTQLKALSILEKNKVYSPDAAAEIFGTLLAQVSVFGIDDELLDFAVCEIMFHIGKWIYLIDAADDFEKDKKEGNYNPFLPDGPDLNDLSDCLDKELYLCEQILAKIPAGDPLIRSVIRNILFYGTEAVKNEVLSKKTKGNAKIGENKYE